MEKIGERGATGVAWAVETFIICGRRHMLRCKESVGFVTTCSEGATQDLTCGICFDAVFSGQTSIFESRFVKTRSTQVVVEFNK